MAVKRLEGSSKPFDGTIGEKVHEFITTFEAWFRSYALRDGHELSDIEKIDAVIHGTTAVAVRMGMSVRVSRDGWRNGRQKARRTYIQRMILRTIRVQVEAPYGHDLNYL